GRQSRPAPEEPAVNEAAFLQAIVEDPEDDVARLACADWLLEQDDPALQARGEFIQVQMRLAGREEHGLAARGRAAVLGHQAHAWELAEREKALLAAHGAAWAAPVAPYVSKYHFRRGFIEQVDLEAERFVGSAVALFSQAPIRRVRLTTG